MNDITNYQAQLPDTLEDLSQFVLVNEERIQALRAQIRAIKKVHLAKEVYEQKLAEAQEIGQITVEAAQKMGELLLQIQKQSGGVNQYNKEENLTDVRKSKMQTVSEMGMSQRQAEQYQQMAQNPEAVQAAIQKAIENGDVVSRNQVMKEIRSAKAEARAELECQLAEKNRRISELENRKPEVKEVVKKVVPDDYQKLKSDAVRLKNESIQWQRNYDNQVNKNNRYVKENADLKEEVRKLKEKTVIEQIGNDLNGSAVTFALKCRKFLEDVGGFLFVAEHLQDLNDKEKSLYIKAAEMINDWSGVLIGNIERNGK